MLITILCRYQFNNMYPWQTGHLGCGSVRLRARARAFARDKRPRETVKIEFAAKPRPAARPIGSAGGPPYRPIGTPGIDVSAKFRNAARERARGDGGGGRTGSVLECRCRALSSAMVARRRAFLCGLIATPRRFLSVVVFPIPITRRHDHCHCPRLSCARTTWLRNRIQ